MINLTKFDDIFNRIERVQLWNMRLGAAKFRAGQPFESCTNEAQDMGWLDAACEKAITPPIAS